MYPLSTTHTKIAGSGIYMDLEKVSDIAYQINFDKNSNN